MDLVVGGDSSAALLEFKYPREPNEKNAAWTMALGEVLKDFYRLAAYQGNADRLFVFVESRRLQRYMAAAGRRYGLDLHTDEIALFPEAAMGLPTTAAQIIGSELAEHRVTGRRTVLASVDEELRLAVYAVEPAAAHLGSDVPPVPKPLLAAADASVGERAESVPGPEAEPPAGVRQEILEAVRAVLIRSGGGTFTIAQIVDEMTRRGSRYAESTVRTMIASHMCRNAPDHAYTTYPDFHRVDRGRYRLVEHLPPSATT